jgi:hypothetical protein
LFAASRSVSWGCRKSLFLQLLCGHANKSRRYTTQRYIHCILPMHQAKEIDQNAHFKFFIHLQYDLFVFSMTNIKGCDKYMNGIPCTFNQNTNFF